MDSKLPNQPKSHYKFTNFFFIFSLSKVANRFIKSENKLLNEESLLNEHCDFTAFVS